MAHTKTQVSELYVAIFNRASEGEGNRYWQGREGSTADIANAMLATEPAQTYFGSATADNRLFIEHIYFNTLGRSAEEDPEGIAYWVGRLEQSSQGDVIVAIIDALLRHAPDASDMHKENQQNFLNRVKVSNYTSDISDAFPPGFDYEKNLGFTTNLSVNADPATVEAAKAKVFALINPDSIFTLQSLPGQTDVDLSIDADPQLSESLLAFLQDVANLDLVAEGLLDEQGNPTGSIGHVSIVDNPADGTTRISITSDDGINGSWQIDGSLAHLASILFGDALDSPATGIVLTTNSNNGGTIEPGFTGVGADHIIVGRPELLHGAYIDGGPGYNTLSIDMSGVFAQPLQLLNIQQVNVTNLPNNYRLDPGIFGDLLTFPGSNLSSELWTTGSTLDLSRATSLEKLLVTESGLSYNDHGPLAVTGIKGSTTARLEGDFHQSVGLYYGSGQGNGIDLELANVTMAEGSLALGHNAGVVRLLSEGAINVLQSADFGDVFRQLIVTGSAELSIQNHLNFAFGEAHIDASANTGGLRLSLSSQHNAPQLDDITIFGSQTRDVITIDASAHGVLLNIDTNTGADTLILDSVHARAGSSITGATLTLRIEGSSSNLTGVNFGNVERIEIAGGSSLTLTQQQLTELGADTFAAGHAAGKVDLHIVVSQSTSLAELLDLDQLDSNVKLSFSVLKGATLSLTAEQLHLYLAHNNAVTGQGDLHITGAGLRFDPETGSAYGTGGRIDKDNIDGTVSITTEYNGFNRPAPGPDSNTLTITADGSGPLIISDDILAPHVSHLIIQGNQDVQLGGNIELGNNFTLNFAGLDGSIDSLTLSHFERISADANPQHWGQIIGNGSGTRLNIELHGDVGTSNPEFGLTTSGIASYVVTALVGEQGAPADHVFNLTDQTRDVEVIGLKGNQGNTLTFSGIPFGRVNPQILLEGDGVADFDESARSDGDPNASNIGKLVALWFRDGEAPGIFNINNAGVTLGERSDGGTRALHVDGIETNAGTVTLNITDGAAVIGNLSADHASNISVSASTYAVQIWMDSIGDALTSIDLSAVEGSTTLGIGAFNPANDSFKLNHYSAAELDLSGIQLLGVDSLALASGSSLTLNINQYLDPTLTLIDASGAAQGASVNVTGLADQAFSFASLPGDVQGGSVTLAVAGDLTLHPDTDLTGVSELIIPAGTSLTLHADQLQQLQGAPISGAGNLSIIGLTQQHVDGGFDLSNISTANLTISLVEDVSLLASDNLGHASVTLGDGLTLTLADIQQADGLRIEGGSDSILRFTDTHAGAFESIDASGFDVAELHLPNVLVDNINIALLFHGLSASILKVIYHDEGWLEAVTQTLVIREGSTVPGFVVFNEPQANTEIQHFILNLQGGTEISGNLRLSSTEKHGALIGTHLKTLVINSSGDAANLLTDIAANVITGDITSQGTGDQGSYTSVANNLLNISINAEQTLRLDGRIIFESVTASDHDDGVTGNDNHAAIARLSITGDADVSLGGLDTSDADVVGLVVNNDGSGTLSLTLNAAHIDADDSLSFLGDNIQLTVSGNLDLSDDVLDGVTQIHLSQQAELTLTLDQAQATALQLADGASTAELNLQGLSDQLFSAADFNGISINQLHIAAEPLVTLHADTELSNIGALIVPQGTVLNLTAAQFQQLAGIGIQGAGGTTDYSINITGLTQADVDQGLDLSGISAANLTISLAEDVSLTATDNLAHASVSIGAGLTLSLADVQQANGRLIEGGSDSILRFTDTRVDAFESIDASGFAVTELHLPNVLIDNINIALLFHGLRADILKVIYHDEGWLEGVTQALVIREGTTVPGVVVFNEPQADTEIQHFILDLQGGTEITGNLRLSAAERDSDLIGTWLQSLVINSSGDAANLITGSAANLITGDITSQGTGDQGSYTSVANNLLNISINAEQAFEVAGSIIFESVNNAQASASLSITGSADVSLGGLDTSDADVVALVVSNDGSGTLQLNLDADQLDADDSLSFLGDNIQLTVSGSLDLSDDVLDGVTQIHLSQQAELTLTLDQAQATALQLADGASAAALNLQGLSDQLFSAADFNGISVQQLTVAAEPTVTLHADTDLSDIGALLVPAGTVLNLTAAQFQQLAGIGIQGAGGTTDYSVNVTGLTQADLDNGLDLSGISADNLTISLAEDVSLAATDNLAHARVILDAGQTLTLADIQQANGLAVDGSAGILRFVDVYAAPGESIDASGLDVAELHLPNVLVHNRNIDQMFSELNPTIHRVIFHDAGWLEGVTQTLDIREGTTVPGFMIFDQPQAGIEIQRLILNLQGGTEVSGNLHLAASQKHGNLIGTQLQSLVINSSGDAANLLTGAATNLITGDITSQADGTPGVVPNNLLSVDINAEQTLVLRGNIIFESVTAADHDDGVTGNDNYAAVAEINIDGSADVELGGVDTTDADVVGLVVNNDGSGTLHLNLNAAQLDASDSLSFLGDNIQLTVTGNLDLSDDVLDGVTRISLTQAELNLTQAQHDALGAGAIVNADTDGIANEVLNLTEFGTAAFNASPLTEQGIEVHLLLAAGDITLNPATDLTGVASITVAEGGSLTLTAAQFLQLAGNGTVLGEVIITDVDQAAVDAGLNLSDIDGSIILQAIENITLPVENDVLNDNTGNLLGAVPGNVTFALDAGIKLTLSDILQLGDRVQATHDGSGWNGATPGTGLGVTGGVLELLFVNGFGPWDTLDASRLNVDTLRLLNELIKDRDVELLQNLASDIQVIAFDHDDIDDLPGYVTRINREFTVEAAASVDGTLAFNDAQRTSEVATLKLILEGNASLNGNLRLSTVEKAEGLTARYFQQLTISSEGAGPNSITGSITPLAANANALDNRLLDVVIEGTQDLQIVGDIAFNGLNTTDSTATLTVDSSAAVSIGGLDTSDVEVTELVVTNDGTGTLSLALNAAQIDADDALSFLGDNIQLALTGSFDLSDDVTSGVSQITLADSQLVLSQAQYQMIAAADGVINGDTDGLDNEVLTLVDFVAAELFDAAPLAAQGIEVHLHLTGQGDVVLNPLTDLTDVASITVAEGSRLILTADQFLQLAGNGTIIGDVVIDLLTQAHVHDGLNFSDVDGHLTLLPSTNITLPVENDVLNDSTGTLLGAAPGNVTFFLADNLKLTLGDILQLGERVEATHDGTSWHGAEPGTGLGVIGGITTTVELLFINGFGPNDTFDASRLNIGTLRMLNELLKDRNVELLQSLNGDIQVVAFDHDDIDDLPGYVTRVYRVFSVEEGAAVDGGLVFNDIQSTTEVSTLVVTLEGDATISGDLRLSTVEKAAGLTARYLQKLTINSDVDGVNTINGDITPLALHPDAIDNRLLDVAINAGEDLVLNGTIVFNGLNASEGTARLTVSGLAAVTIGGLDTSDAEVVELIVENVWAGILDLTLNADNIDATDSLSFLGEPIQLTLVGEFDLSDDIITGVTQITLADSQLILSHEQYDALSATPAILNGDTDGLGNEVLTLVEFDGAEEFDAKPLTVDEGIEVHLQLIAGDISLNALTDLTDVDSITVAEGGSLTLTAAQFMQMENGTILGAGGSTDFTVTITDLTQLQVDEGFDLSNIAAGSNIVIQPAESIVLPVENDVLTSSTGTVLGALPSHVTFELEDGHILTLSDILQLGNRVEAVFDGTSWIGVEPGTGLTVTGTAVELLFVNGFGPNDTVDASNLSVEQLRLLNELLKDRNVELLQHLAETVEVVFFDHNDIDDLPGYVTRTDREVVVEEGTLVDGALVFNDIQSHNEIANLTILMDGNASINGTLGLATVQKAAGLTARYFDTLTINSEGAGPNSITGNISPFATEPGTIDNRLLNVEIEADQAFTLDGTIVFNGLKVSEDTARLMVSGTDNVSIGGLDTSDVDVTELVVSNDSTGTLSLALKAAQIDADDALSFLGTGDIELTLTGSFDLSDDTLTAVTQITIDDNAQLTLTQAQYDTLTPTGIANGNDNPGIGAAETEVLNLVEFAGANVFDATQLPAGIAVHLFLADGAQSLDNATDLTGVDSITVAPGGSLTLTAAQFMQMENGTILGAGGSTDFTVTITGLDQAGVNDGFDLSNIAAGSNIVIQPTGDINLAPENDTSAGNNIGTVLGASPADVEFVLADNATLGLGDILQLGARGALNGAAPGTGLTVTSESDPAVATAVELQFVNGFGPFDIFDASNLSVVTLRLPNDLVDNRDIELLQGLASSVTVEIYDGLGELPGYVAAIERTVDIEADTSIDGFLVFNDYQNHSKVVSLTLNMLGDASIDGNLRLSTVPKDPELVNLNFTTLTINSLGTAANSITGDITPLGVAPLSEDNRLLDVVINATTADLLIAGDIVFNSLRASDDTASLTLSGAADVTVQQLDISDPDIHTLQLTNDGTGTGTLTVTGASPAIITGAGSEALILAGDGDMVFSDDDSMTSNVTLDSDTLSLIDASELEGALSLGELKNIDNADFSFIAGTGRTTITLTDADLDNDVTAGQPGWSFDFSAADTGSAFHFKPLNGVFVGGDLAIELGANTTLYIDADTDLSALDSLLIGGTGAIVVADGVTLTLTAEQADGLDIIGASGLASTGVVNLTNLDSSEVDLSGIQEELAGLVSLRPAEQGATDITLHPDTDLGYFGVLLRGDGDAIGDGQTIRFWDETQAGRRIEVEDAGNGTGGTNVVWMFDSIVSPVVTDDYSADLGRLWMTASLVNGSNVEDLYTSLPFTTLRIEFIDNGAAPLVPQGFDRVVELVAGTQLPGGLEFDSLDEHSYIASLSLHMGGQVNLGNLLLDHSEVGSVFSADGAVTLSISSVQAIAGSRLAPNDWPLVTGPNRFADISAGSDIGLVNLTLSTATQGDELGNALSGGTVSFSSIDPTGQQATLTLLGDQHITLKALASGLNIDSLSIDTSGHSATFEVTGGSPALDVDGIQSITLNVGNDGLVQLGTETDGSGNPYAGIAGADLTELLVITDFPAGSASVDLGIIALVNSQQFTLNGSGSGVTRAVLGAANVDVDNEDLVAPELDAEGVWTISNVSLTLTDEVTLNDDATLALQFVELTIGGDVDVSELNFSATGGTISVPAGSSLTLTAGQADELDISGAGSVVIAGLQLTPDADLSDIGTDSVTAELDSGTAPNTVDLTGNLGSAHVIVSGTGTVSISGEIGQASFELTDAATLELTAAQADARQVTESGSGAGSGTVNVTGLTPAIDLTGLQVDSVNVTVTDNQTLTDAANLAAAVITVAAGTTLTAPASVVHALTIEGEGTVIITGDAIGADFSRFTINNIGFATDAVVDSVTFPTLTGDPSGSDPVQTVTLTAAQADGETINGADSGSEGRVLVTALGNAPVDLSGINANDMRAHIPANATLDSNTNLGDFALELADGVTLALTAEQADARSISGNGNVLVGELGSDPVDLSGITNTGTQIAHVPSTAALHGNTDLGDFELVLLTTVTLTLTAAQANGLSISGTGNVAVTDLGTAEVDLSGITNTGSKTIAVSADTELHANTDLGDFELVVADTATLTLTAAQADGLSISGAGNVVVTDLGTAAVDLSGITNTGGQIAHIPADATLDDGIDLGGFELVVAGSATLTLTAAQANDLSISGDGNVVVTGLGTGAVDLSGITNTGSKTIAVSADTELHADTDLGDFELVVADSATLTLTADQANGPTISGDGTVQVTALDQETIVLTEDIRYSELVFAATDTGVSITDFEAGSFTYSGADTGFHSLDFTAFFSGGLLDFEDVDSLLTGGDNTGLADILSFSVTDLADLQVGTLAAAFQQDGEFESNTGVVNFGSGAEKIFLVSNGTDTGVFFWQDDSTVNGEVEADELTQIATLTGLNDGELANLENDNFIL